MIPLFIYIFVYVEILKYYIMKRIFVTKLKNIILPAQLEVYLQQKKMNSFLNPSFNKSMA